MPDNTLSFVTKVDLGGLKSGLSEASSSVQSFAGTLESAMAAAATAAANLADAQAQLGASIEGNANASILLEYQAALDAANASVQALTVSEGASDAVAQKSAYSRKQIADALAAQNRANNITAESEAEAARATELLALKNDILARTAAEASDSELLLGRSSLEAAAGMEVSARAAGHQVTALQATSGTIRELNGSLPIRAVENFISKTLGLGPILQAAFPIVGAIALGEVIFDLGEKLNKMYTEAENAGHAIQEAWARENDALQVSNDSLTVSNDKLENTIAKLQGKPQNGLQLGLDEAREAADKLGIALQKDIDKSSELITKNQIGFFGKLLGKAGTEDSAKIVTDTNAKLEAIKNSYQETIDAATDQGATRQNIVDIKQAELSRLEKVYADAEQHIRPILKNYQEDLDLFKTSAGGRGRDTSANVSLLQGYLNQMRQEQRMIGEEFRKETDEQTLAPLQVAKSHSATINPDTSALKDIEAKFQEVEAARVQITGHPLTPGEALSFWSPFLSEFEDRAKQYRSLIEEAGSYEPGSAMSKQLLVQAKEFEGANAAYTKIQSEVLKGTESIHKALMAARKKDAEETKKQDEEDVKGIEALAKGLRAAHQMVVDVNAASAQQQHETNLGNIETAQAQSTNTNALSLVPNPDAQLNALRQFHAQALEEDARFIQQEIGIYSNEPKKVAELEKQLAEVRRKANIQWLNDTRRIDQEVVDMEKQALTKMENDIAHLFATAITSTESWAQASARLFDQVANQFITNLVKMGEQEIVAALLHKNLLKQGIIGDAYKAGADAYAWATSWGGPVAGAIAAAAAFAGVLAFDSFEAGGVVGGGNGMPVPIMAHAGERVLSKAQTDMFHQVVNNQQGGAAGSLHLNYQPTIHAQDRAGMQRALRDEKDTLIDLMRGAYKSGALKP